MRLTLALWVSLYNSRFQNHGAETRGGGPVSFPGGQHLSCASPTKHLTEQGVAPGVTGVADSAARDLAAALHTGDFLDSGALKTGLGMLLIQHCALKSHFED